MRPVIKWGLIIGGVAFILALGLGLGLGLDNDPGPTTTAPPATTTTIPPIGLTQTQVNTKYGIVEGYQFDPNATVDLPMVNAEHDSTVFLGIPYASPPVGENRWRAPVEPESWKDVKQTKTFSSMCAQKCNEPCGDISEDCLYLNVFTPTGTIRDNRTAAVGVWFHGGAFTWGAGGSPLYNGQFVAPMMDMVIVTVNYRMSAFGFLSLDKIEDGQETDANWGFLDQRMSLKWVHENIKNFGGDPERIMVFGQSAGSISTTAHLVHQPSADMIKRVIVHSNPHSIPFKEQWEAKKQFRMFNEAAGCQAGDVACLRNLSLEQVVTAVDETPLVVSGNLLLAAMKFAPTIDNYIFHEQPYRQLVRGDYNKSIDIISGTVQHETEIFVRSLFTEPINGAVYKAALILLLQDSEIVDQILEKYPPKCAELMDRKQSMTNRGVGMSFEKCKERLCGLEQIDCRLMGGKVEDACNKAIDTFVCATENPDFDERITFELPGTEWIFTCPEKKWVKSHEDQNVYMYHFRAKMPIDISKIGSTSRAGWESYERCKYLSCHAADLSYTFEVENQVDCNSFEAISGEMITCTDGELITPDFKQLERFLHRYWGNFARTGDPNNGAGAKYSSELQEIYDQESLPRWTPITSETESVVVHFGYNDENDAENNCAVDGGAGAPCMIKFDPVFKKDECSFWDGLKIYPDDYKMTSTTDGR